MRRASDTELSITEAVVKNVQMDYTMGSTVYLHPYQLDAIRTSLRRGFPSCCKDIHDEVSKTLEDLIPVKSDWIPIHASGIIKEVVCRCMNRVYVGIPLCRNKDYIELNIQYTVDVVTSAIALSVLPKFLKPIAAFFISPIKSSTARAVQHLGKLIQERMEMDEVNGMNWPGRPNDLISWLLEHAKGDQRTVEGISQRLLFINFASIHTTSNILTQALYRIAAHQDYVEPMKDEIKVVLGEECGWTYAAVSKLVKVDSFLRECMRIEGLGQFTMSRIVSNPAGFKFHDGTTLPYGTFLSCGAYSIHHDHELYDKSDEFDGFRFCKDDGSETTEFKQRIVNSSFDFVAFGRGTHACPGRFYAATQMKIIFSQIIMSYDVSYTGDPPKTKWYGEGCIADPESRIIVRRTSGSRDENVV
ncbi:cytochrome P450 [Cyathus striatus]|nr:cytochrome P450 [Cyathus striatus]